MTVKKTRGMNNSSTYRVRPLMEYVRSRNGALTKLLALVGISINGDPTEYRYDGALNGEKQLPPTKKHLEALLDTLVDYDKKTIKRGSGKILIVGEERESLFSGDYEKRVNAINKAKKLLSEEYDSLTPSSRKWYMLEGFTHPDIFIEGEDYIIVAEGKWTEPHITTTTSYLVNHNERNQMARHIQGALNYAAKNGNKKVYAFYIVDGDQDYANTLTGLRLDKEAVELNDSEKEEILNAYRGYTTWQKIENIFEDIKFRPKL